MTTHPQHGGETPLAGAGPRPIFLVRVRECVRACVRMCALCVFARACSFPLATVHVDLLSNPSQDGTSSPRVALIRPFAILSISYFYIQN